MSEPGVIEVSARLARIEASPDFRKLVQARTRFIVPAPSSSAPTTSLSPYSSAGSRS